MTPPNPRKDNHFLRSINIALETFLRWIFVGMIFMDGLKVLECVIFRKAIRDLVQTEGKTNRCRRSQFEEGREWSHAAPGQGMLTASGARVGWTDSALEPLQHLDSNTMKPIQPSALQP